MAVSGAVNSVAIGGRVYPITDHSYDVVVVGAGGAGLRAVVVGLNPRAARPIIAAIDAWKGRDLDLFFL